MVASTLTREQFYPGTLHRLSKREDAKPSVKIVDQEV
jgi:hypothetical protein